MLIPTANANNNAPLSHPEAREEDDPKSCLHQVPQNARTAVSMFVPFERRANEHPQLAITFGARRFRPPAPAAALAGLGCR